MTGAGFEAAVGTALLSDRPSDVLLLVLEAFEEALKDYDFEGFEAHRRRNGGAADVVAYLRALAAIRHYYFE
jgi:hypothetical protein